ncbi:MAG: DUF1828 domain-containing protein [Gammaproteobacteria bacterium]|nr:DUF1828 domain-containing protein [Gammaproteobacteria bacterium]
MDISTIEQSFREKVSKKIRIQQEGINRFLVFTPFMFDDGDHLVIIIRTDDDRIVLTDEAHTFMHLTYWIKERDLLTGTRQTIVSNALSMFGVQDIDGELILEVPDQQYGDALFSFIQAILKISNVSFLRRERVRSLFMEDFRSLLMKTVDRKRMVFDWNDPERDPDGKYVIDCRINGTADPLYIIALNSDNKTRDATIALLQFEKWGKSFRSMAIFENQETINRKVLARFTDVCDRQFSSITTKNQERIQKFLSESTGSSVG